MPQLTGIIVAFGTVILIAILAVFAMEALSYPYNSLTWPADYLYFGTVALIAAVIVLVARQIHRARQSANQEEKVGIQIVKGFGLALAGILLIAFLVALTG